MTKVKHIREHLILVHYISLDTTKGGLVGSELSICLYVITDKGLLFSNSLVFGMKNSTLLNQEPSLILSSIIQFTFS
jgi:hypothetical protein